MVLLLDGWGDALKTSLLIHAACAVVVILAYWLSTKINNGRGVLFKFVQDFGYDDFRTLDALSMVMKKVLKKDEGMPKDGKIFLWHDIGNRYSGTYCDNDNISHDITVQTDGWYLQYQIDDDCPRRIKL